MSIERHDAVAAIHSTEPLLVLAVTGGGVASVSDLLSVGGASRTVLEVTVPYAGAALEELVGGPVDQAVSVRTAREMAIACLERARVLAPDATVLGVACTAALATDRPKRGDHRAHVAVASTHSIASWSLTLDKDARDRIGEDRVVSDLVLRAIATSCGTSGPLPVASG